MANDIKINFIGTVVDSVDLPKFETASVADLPAKIVKKGINWFRERI